METVVTESRVLLSVGKCALEYSRDHLAQTALHKIECLAEEKGLEAGEDVYNLLGLLALWADDEVTRLRAKSYLDEVKDSFKPSFGECVQKAADFHYRGARFDIAFKVRNLKANLAK